jgi:DNA replication and repair protein RecF
VFLRDLRLVNFRSYCDDTVAFGPGLNVVVGANATGKTNLLEGAFFALRGTSPRTRREEKLVAWGQRFLRVTVRLDDLGDRPQEVEVAYAPGAGKRVRWDGVEVAALDDLRRRCQVFIFVPESLLLVKGSPARRRAHLDAFAAAVDPPYAVAARDAQAALRQRNAQLVAVRAGAAPATLDPWDTQFARAAVELGRRRRALVADLRARFSALASGLAPAGERFVLQLVSQVEGLGYDEQALLARLRERRLAEVQRGLTLVGPHRDDLRFVEVGGESGGQAAGLPPGEAGTPAVETPPENTAVTAEVERNDAVVPAVDAGAVCGTVALPAGGRDLRLFGSQGEQRAAVLALLLAEQALAAERTGGLGALFLDDVMSELDDARRRLLVASLAGAGQAIITTTNRHYFTDEELGAATVIELPLGAGGGADRPAA